MMRRVEARRRPGRITVVCAVMVLAGYGGPLSGQEDQTRVFVRSVSDGDTIALEGGGRVRYLGIDAPEVAHEGQPGEPFGDAAATHNRNLVSGRRVKLEFERDRHDAYGRLLAYVFLEDGTLANNELVRQGLACVCPRQRPLRYWDLLLESQRQAMKDRRGLWSLPPPRPEPVYLGNKRSWIFHRASCPLGRNAKPTSLVRFNERSQAFAEGFCPCRRCRP
jgi:endonuclease YncB( thermonuclease family)